MEKEHFKWATKAEFKQKFDISEIPTTDPNGLENPEAWMETVPESGRYKNDRIQNGLDYNSFLIDKLANDQIDPEDRDAVIDMLKENLFKMCTAANTAIDKGNVYCKFPTHKVIRK